MLFLLVMLPLSPPPFPPSRHNACVSLWLGLASCATCVLHATDTTDDRGTLASAAGERGAGERATPEEELRGLRVSPFPEEPVSTPEGAESPAPQESPEAIRSREAKTNSRGAWCGSRKSRPWAPRGGSTPASPRIATLRSTKLTRRSSTSPSA